jgi:hypothetical protein
MRDSLLYFYSRIELGSVAESTRLRQRALGEFFGKLLSIKFFCMENYGEKFF